MIQQGPIPFRCGLQTLQQISKHFYVQSINLGNLFDPFRIISMMRKWMMRIVDSDFRINAVTSLATDDQRDDSSQIRLKCQYLQVAHQFYILWKFERNTAWLLDARCGLPWILFRTLNSLLDFPY